jgi:hypothetical protein
MAFIEQFGQKKREDEQAARAESEPKRIPLAQILADKEQSRLFSAYLEQGEVEDVNGDEEDPSKIRLDKKSLGEKLFNRGELTEADVDALYEETGKFFAIKERAQRVRQAIEGNKDALIHASPELRKIVELAEPGVVDAALLERFEEISITHPEVLAALEGSFTKFSAANESIAMGNERIAAYCKEYNLTEDEYFEALRKRDAGEPYALEDLVKSKMSMFQRLKAKFGSYEDFMNNVNDDLDRRDYVKEKLAVADESLAEAGTILRTTLFHNKEAKQTLEANLEHKEGPAPKVTFVEARELFATPYGDAEREDVKARYKAYKKAHSGDQGYSDDRAREAVASSYIKEKVLKKKGGFWAVLFEGLFSSAIKKDLSPKRPKK